jgi:hypothetical protein
MYAQENLHRFSLTRLPATLRNLLDVLDVANLLNITNGAFRRYHLSKMAKSFECQAHIDDLTVDRVFTDLDFAVDAEGYFRCRVRFKVGR